MSQFAETRAVLLRWAIGRSGFVGAQEMDEITEWFGDFLTCLTSPLVATGAYDRRPDGGARLTLPTRITDTQRVQLSAHELGHALLDLPPAERSRDKTSRRRLPKGLAQQLQHADETECLVFADALRLPRGLMRRYLSGEHPDWGNLMEDSGCARLEIERRAEWMRGHPAPRLRTPPPWSAWHCYRLARQAASLISAVVLVPLQAGANEIVIPYRGEREFRALYRSLRGSLAALRPHEFRAKYGVDEVTRWDLFAPWEEWRDQSASPMDWD